MSSTIDMSVPWAGAQSVGTSTEAMTMSEVLSVHMSFSSLRKCGVPRSSVQGRIIPAVPYRGSSAATTAATIRRVLGS